MVGRRAAAQAGPRATAGSRPLGPAGDRGPTARRSGSARPQRPARAAQLVTRPTSTLLTSGGQPASATRRPQPRLGPTSLTPTTRFRSAEVVAVVAPPGAASPPARIAASFGVAR